jgi:tetrahydromethanopterin S-methyltransferase subunit D
MVASFLRRGMAAGLMAGLLAGLFAFFFGEPSVDRAIEIEQASAVVGQGEEVFSRATQKVGLFFVTGLFGVTVGGVFGLAFAYFRDRLVSESDWYRSLTLAAAVFAGAFLIPFVKYPANPPTVGDPSTIGERTASYLLMVAASLFVIVAGWYAARLLRERGVAAPKRQLAVGAGAVAAVTALFLALPAAPDPGGFPAGLLWSFRLSSLGTQLVFWTGLGMIFGLLCERANRREAL